MQISYIMFMEEAVATAAHNEGLEFHIAAIYFNLLST
jgi:hypothetical protein